MKVIEMLNQGGLMALQGIGILFGFIVILIGFILIMNKYIPNQLTVKTEKTQVFTAASTGSSADIIAAITAAVNEYRKNENR